MPKAAAGARDFRTHVGRVCTPAEFLDVVEQYFPRAPFEID